MHRPGSGAAQCDTWSRKGSVSGLQLCTTTNGLARHAMGSSGWKTLNILAAEFGGYHGKMGLQTTARAVCIKPFDKKKVRFRQMGQLTLGMHRDYRQISSQVPSAGSCQPAGMPPSHCLRGSACHLAGVRAVLSGSARSCGCANRLARC